MNLEELAKHYAEAARDQLYRKINRDDLPLTKHIVISDTDRYDCVDAYFQNGVVLRMEIREEGGNCWEVSQTVYSDFFITSPIPKKPAEQKDSRFEYDHDRQTWYDPNNYGGFPSHW